jgi:formate dehydrogenase major subunit
MNMPTLRAVINGIECQVAPGDSILAVLGAMGLEVPTLCHDPRLRPTGMCRLCAVTVEGCARPVVACATPVTDGMVITTHSTELEGFRRTTLELLATRCAPDSRARLPEKEFHRALDHYAIATGAEPVAATSPGVDDSHPYIHVDMSQCIQCYRCVRICDEVQGLSVWHQLGRAEDGRIVPDSMTSLRESSCTGCGACVDTCPTGALVDKSRLALGPAAAWTKSICGYCAVGCELNVGTRDGQVVQVTPVIDSPVNKGHLCIKGRYAFEFNNAPDRATQPLLRRNGEWVSASWPAAIESVATSLARVLDRHGPQAIGVLGSARATNEDNYVIQKFARTVLGTNNVDCCARVCHTPSAAALKRMLGFGAATNSFDDIEQAGAFLLVGCNPTENHPVVGARFLQQVRTGKPLVVIDPRATELARRATVHLQPRAGTNIPLLNALAHVILQEALTDEAFVSARVEGLAGFAALVSSWSPERAAGICNVPAEDIRQAARIYAQTSPAMCFHGLGVTEHVQGTEGVMCLINLALLTGNIGKPGAGVNPLRGQNNVQGAAHMGCDPGLLTGGAAIEPNRARFAALWNATIPTEPGRNLPEMIEAAARGELKCLWIVGYDVLPTLPNRGETLAALGRLDTVIVQDLFINETAREFATVFLPAASVFEQDGTFMNSERRIQRVRQAVPPPGGARPDWRILCDVARAMGHESEFAWASAADIWDEVRAAWPAGAGATAARLEDSGVQWPCADESAPGTEYLYKESFGHGPRARLACIDYAPTVETVDAAFPLLLTTGRSLYQFNAGTMTGRGRARELRPTDLLDINPLDATAAGIASGDAVTVRSRYGKASLPARVTNTVRPGELFATFQDPASMVNQLTSSQGDRITRAPEYKVTAVCLERPG